MTNEMPDWMRPMTPEELLREAMDYELNAEYDRFDGMRMDFCGVDSNEYDDEPMTAEQMAAFKAELATMVIQPVNDDDVPF